MYFLIIFILLSLSFATLFLTKSYPTLKPLAFVLPVAAILMLIFKPGTRDRIPVSQRLLDEQAAGVGTQLARTITDVIPQNGLVFVVHPHESAATYTISRVQQHLQGLRETLETSGFTLATHPLVEADAANDPVTDGTYIGGTTLSKLVSDQSNPVCVVLVGLHFALAEDQQPPSLPPLVLATIGDPGTSEWALDSGLAVVALFEKISAPLTVLQNKSLSAEEKFNARYELRTSTR